MMRARLGRYAIPQFGDYFVDRGVLLVVLVAFLGWGHVISNRVLLGPGWADGTEGAMRAATAFDSLLTLVGVAGALMGINGISSKDRQRGYFRLLFSRPVRVEAFYAQSYVVLGLGLLVLGGAVAALFSFAIARQHVPGAIGYIALCWLVIGALGFLLSAMTRLDGAVLLLMLLLGTLLNGYLTAAGFAGARVNVLLRAAQYVLPPMHLLAEARRNLMQGTMPASSDLGWMLGFGAVCFVVGLLVLRRRPLAT